MSSRQDAHGTLLRTVRRSISCVPGTSPKSARMNVAYARFARRDNYRPLGPPTGIAPGRGARCDCRSICRSELRRHTVGCAVQELEVPLDGGRERYRRVGRPLPYAVCIKCDPFEQALRKSGTPCCLSAVHGASLHRELSQQQHAAIAGDSPPPNSAPT